MAEKPPLKVAVVGHNLSSALWLRALRAMNLDLELSWHQTDDDRENPAADVWVIVPNSVREPLRGLVPAIRVDTPYIFLPKSRRIPAMQVLSLPQSTFPVHEAVRKKLLALTLWSDLTPLLWKQRGAHWEPNTNWMDETPRSLRDPSSGPFWLINRAQALGAIATELEQGGVQIFHGDSGVLGVSSGSRSEGHRLVHNAPYGVTNADHIVWTSVQKEIKDEESRGWRKIKARHQAPIGAWMSRGAWVDSSAVTGLPAMSTWVDSQKTGSFYSSGILTSGELKRVLCIDGEALPNSPSGKSFLQIDEFVFENAPLDQKNILRDDSFLNELCPQLGRVKKDYSHSACEHNCIFESPLAIEERLAPGVEFWFRSSMGDPHAAVQSWLKRNIPARQRRTVAVQPTTTSSHP
ncbi:MAG: hypothetical protein JST16_08510 [Bdellovibrionales bacterium]|nr:hypothetical protein [Bdellovibrionales bacterium]